jgi:hypothetical protein
VAHLVKRGFSCSFPLKEGAYPPYPPRNYPETDRDLTKENDSLILLSFFNSMTTDYQTGAQYDSINKMDLFLVLVSVSVVAFHVVHKLIDAFTPVHLAHYTDPHVFQQPNPERNRISRMICNE